MSENKVEFGLENVHCAKMKIAADGTISYDKPFRIPGAVTLKLDAEGENTPFHADNVIYYNSYANNGYKGDLEIAKIPEKFRIDILGEKKDKKTGGLLEIGNAEISPFAFFYQIEGDITATRYVYYNTTVSRPSKEAATTEGNKSPKTNTLSISTTPRKDKRVKFDMSLDEAKAGNKEVYDKFFDDVYEPTEFEGDSSETPTV